MKSWHSKLKDGQKKGHGRVLAEGWSWKLTLTTCAMRGTQSSSPAEFPPPYTSNLAAGALKSFLYGPADPRHPSELAVRNTSDQCAACLNRFQYRYRATNPDFARVAGSCCRPLGDMIDVPGWCNPRVELTKDLILQAYLEACLKSPLYRKLVR